MSGRTLYDVIFQLIHRYKLVAVAAVAIVFAGGWFVTHLAAKPGTEVSVWGLFKYTKSDDTSQAAYEKGRQEMAEKEREPIPGETTTLEGIADEARGAVDVQVLKDYTIYLDDDNEPLYFQTKKLLLELGLRSRDGICDDKKTFVRYYHTGDKQAAILLAETLHEIMPVIETDFFEKEAFGDKTLYVCIF